jgi:hypothetical protein
MLLCHALQRNYLCVLIKKKYNIIHHTLVTYSIHAVIITYIHISFM